MANTSTVTTPQKGMMLDLHNTTLQEGMYTYALNATLEQNTEDGFVLQNDSSNLLSILFPEGYNPLGVMHVVEQERIIFFLSNGINHEIGEVIYKNAKYDNRVDAQTRKSFCLNCGSLDLIEPIPLEKVTPIAVLKYRSIVSSPDLNFSKLYSIDSEYKISDCTLQLYFVDGFNEDRYIYFDYNDKDQLTVQPIFLKGNVLDVNKILIQPKVLRPNIFLEDVFSGGQLIQGVYQFFVAYSTATGQPLTSYYGSTQPIPVFTKVDPDDNRYVTDQAIKVRFENITKDSIYQYFTVVVAETIENVTEYKIAATLPINQETYIYSGNNQLPKTTLSDVIQKYPFYRHSSSITKSNEYLFRANLIEEEQLNLQRVANNIKVGWKTVVLKEGDFRKPEIAQKYRCFMRDEVYPLGVIFEISGVDTPSFHIPGRTATKKDLELLSPDNQDVISEQDCNTELRNKRWQTYNTGSVDTKPRQAYNSCLEAVYETGTMSYWESTDLYPDNKLIWGDLANQPIRHHKFPDNSITHIHENLNARPYTVQDVPRTLEQIYNAKLNIHPIGFDVDHNSIVKALDLGVKEGVLTEEQRKRITGYRIVRGNRADNKSVVAKGYLADMWSYVKNAQTYYYPNYPYNDLRTDPFIAKNNFYKGTQLVVPFLNPIGKVPYLNEFIPTGRYTFNSPDTQFVEPPQGSILKLEVESYGKSKGYFNEADKHAKHRFINQRAYSIAGQFGAGIAQATTINDETEAAASNLGATLGGAVGTIAGGPIGAAIGSVAGSLLGGLFANNMSSRGPDAFWKDVAEAMTRMALAIHNTQKLVTFFRFLIPFRNYNYQFNSVANYNSYLNVDTNKGIKQRAIETFNYLRPEVNSVTESGSAVFINNYNRESSVYIKVKGGFLPSPFIEDDSRYTISNVGHCNDYETEQSIHIKNVSWYYASIKNNRLNQYGSVYNIEYLETNSLSYAFNNNNNKSKTIFGGDTFINRYAFKRKHSFFTANTFQLPDETDFYHSDFANVGYPVYYTNTQGDDDFYLKDPFSFFNLSYTASGFLDTGRKVNVPNMTQNLAVSRQPKLWLDCVLENKVQVKGAIYLYSYGIPNVFVESDINLDFRQAQGTAEKDFYPRQQNLDYWLQEKNVSIKNDNTYLYNKTYSKQNKESFIAINNALFQPDKPCTVKYPNRVIYSNQAAEIDSNNSKDSWLIYKANNYYDFSKTNGNLISVEGLENNKILARFEQTSQVFNAYVTLQTNASNIQVDTGGMFQTKPQEYAHTELGYAGSQHKAILHTEFGHVTVDAKRGQVFLLQGGLDEISKDGMKNWFAKNLPFEIEKYFDLPNHVTDNSYFGIGLSLYYDRTYKRLFMTKLDYKPLKPEITYQENIGFFFKNIPIDLKDKSYFEDLSWTLSYNFYTKSWVSFHSFKPNYAVNCIDFFLTGINNNTKQKGSSSAWAHNVTNRSYQVYYGKKQPFVIETFAKITGKQHIFGSVEYNADVWLYNKGLTKTRLKALPFNKVIVYTDKSNSGLLEGNVISNNDLYSQRLFPKYELNRTQITVVNKESNWRLNQFKNIIINNVPVWIQKTDAKELNPKALRYMSNPLDNYPIRGEWCRVQLINDNWTNYKIIIKWLINHSTQSFS